MQRTKRLPPSATAPDPATQHKDIGQSLRNRRRQLGLSIADVANASNLSIGYISQLERNLASPSITALMRIAQVLDVSMDTIFQPPEARGHHFPLSSRTPFALEPGGMQFDRISGQFPFSVINALIVTVPAGHKASHPITHEGEELVYVLSGQLSYTLGERKFIIGPGDCVHLPSTTRHGWSNPFDQDARLLWAGTIQLFQHDDQRHPESHALHRHGSPVLAQPAASSRKSRKPAP